MVESVKSLSSVVLLVGEVGPVDCYTAEGGERIVGHCPRTSYNLWGEQKSSPVTILR